MEEHFLKQVEKYYRIVGHFNFNMIDTVFKPESLTPLQVALFTKMWTYIIKHADGDKNAEMFVASMIKELVEETKDVEVFFHVDRYTQDGENMTRMNYTIVKPEKKYNAASDNYL